MKTLKILSCFFVCLTFVYCTTVEEQLGSNAKITTANRQSFLYNDDNNPLLFKWGLYHLSGGFAGFDEYFTYGQITWKFNINDQTFTVLNITNSFPSGGYLPSGTYPCNITANTDGTFCFSTATLSGCSTLKSNILYLSEGKVADGIALQFVH